MKALKKEIDANFEKFSDAVSKTRAKSEASLSVSSNTFQASYLQIVSIQAWKSELLEEIVDENSLRFFLESQNDLLTSHLMAKSGYWRSSLQSLRSAIEGVMCCLYYMDHKIEYSLWESGNHRLGNADLRKYLKIHPMHSDVVGQLDGLAILSSQYALLSKAVHASANNFRMTNHGQIVLLSDDTISLAKWARNERSVIRGMNLLLLAIFRAHLNGTQKRNLRKSLSFSLTKTQRTKVKERYKVKLFEP